MVSRAAASLVKSSVFSSDMDESELVLKFGVCFIITLFLFSGLFSFSEESSLESSSLSLFGFRSFLFGTGILEFMFVLLQRVSQLSWGGASHSPAARSDPWMVALIRLSVGSSRSMYPPLFVGKMIFAHQTCTQFPNDLSFHNGYKIISSWHILRRDGPVPGKKRIDNDE